MGENATELRRPLNAYLAALDGLRPYAIDSIADYTDYLFEQGLGGKRVARGVKGHDVIVPRVGRIQVKERRLPADGRVEERLHLRNLGCDSCDSLGAVIFNNDLTIKKALLVAHRDVWPLIVKHPDPERKVRFDLLAALPPAIDVTFRLRAVQG